MNLSEVKKKLEDRIADINAAIEERAKNGLPYATELTVQVDVYEEILPLITALEQSQAHNRVTDNSVCTKTEFWLQREKVVAPDKRATTDLALARSEFEKKIYSTGQTSDWQQTAIRIFKETMGT
jgi:hypothetical protein